MPHEPDHRALRADPKLLEEALEKSRTSGRVAVELATVAVYFIHDKRFTDALRIFDRVLSSPNHDLSAYCNALWVVQQDNTGLPIDEARSRRYLELSLPHATLNPPIWLNAAGVLLELGETDHAVELLRLAARRNVPLAKHFESPLMEPVKQHALWPVLEKESQPSRWKHLSPYEVWRANTPKQMVDQLLGWLDDADPRVAHGALRQLIWWREEDCDDGHGGRAFPELLEWLEKLGAEIDARITTERLGDCIERDIDGLQPDGAASKNGPYAFEAAYSFHILVCNTVWERAASVIARLSDRLERALTSSDFAVRAQVLNALARSTWNPQSKAVITEKLQQPLVEFVRHFAKGPGLSDVPRQHVEDIRNAVWVLDALGALSFVRTEVQTIVDKSRGELWDDFTRGDFIKRLSGSR